MLSIANDTTFEDFSSLLTLVKVDVATFDQRARKPLKHLHSQITGLDIKPMIVGPDFVAANGFDVEKVDPVLLVRMTVKMHVETEDSVLLETKRIFDISGTPEAVVDKKDCAGTETRKRGESVLKCAVRGFWEEFGLIVKPTDLRQRFGEDKIGDVHMSSVYPRFMSQQLFQEVRLVLPKRPWKNGKIYRDGGIKIHTRWFPRQRP